ncbi:SDR family oxidoreductase [Dactylosporangium sp. CS-047395]|uniref:SDR family oxidoreductase n=1 Tax=Dactylosporangium sp. CS-047395 TaxID=3239936 RepID=UPI003D8D6C3B
MTFPLTGRAALVTGVSRRAGIGFAVARRLAALGASVYLHHHVPHDHDQPWGADPGGPDAVAAGVAEALADPAARVAHGGAELAARLAHGGADPVARVAHGGADLADPDAPERVVAAAYAEFGHLDILVCNHARSGGDGPLGILTAAMLDGHYAVNTRATILLTQAFAARHDGRPGGRVVFMTSGQDLGPMRDQVPYAASKGALASITRTLADTLADRGITLNTINPGPVDTGYAPPDVHEQVRRHFPTGRWGEPDDPARLIAWLATDDGAWITGQVINTEGGFRRFD